MNSSKPALKRPTKPSPFADLPFDSWPAVLPKTSEDPVLPLAIGIADDLMLRLRRCLRTRGTTFRSSCDRCWLRSLASGLTGERRPAVSGA